MNKYVVKDNDSIVIETTPGLRQGFSIHGACDKLNELTAKVEALENENKRLLAVIDGTISVLPPRGIPVDGVAMNLAIDEALSILSKARMEP